MRRYVGGAATATLAVGMAIAGSASAAGSQETGQADVSSACDVRVLAGPAGGYDGTVMDIERVPGKGVVYYGSIVVPEAGGSDARRAFVWYGVDAQPVQVGPAGTLWDVALELTSTGIVNGQSVVDDSGRERAWTQSLRTGKVSWVETADAEGIYVRRINDRGEPAGTLYGEGFSADAARWLRPDRAPELLPSGPLGFAEAWAITDGRDVVGSWATETPEGAVPQGVVWSKKGGTSLLASNDGVAADSYPRLLSEAGQAAGEAWYGPWDGGHYEAARWPDADVIEPLGLLPGGGYSGAYGQSQGGWVTGVADRFDPESPAAPEWGAVDHSVLWMEDASVAYVLPSPYAVAAGETDWREWYGGVAHGVNDALDQVGSASHVGWGDAGELLYGPTVYLNASACGAAVATTHLAFWEVEATQQRRSAAGTQHPDAYRHEVVRERVTDQGR